MAGLNEPLGWPGLADQLYDSAQTRQPAERLGAAFGDPALFARLRDRLADVGVDNKTKNHAIGVLASDNSVENLPILLALLDNEALAVPVILALKKYSHPSVASALIDRFPGWDDAASNIALEVLCSRSQSAMKLLDAIDAGDIEKSRLSAFYARQMSNLGDATLNDRLARQWGRLGQSSKERLAEIKKLATAYKTAPLWAYNQNAGKTHFKKLCAACHQPDDSNARLAPKLAGTGAKGVDYIVENIIDPNAVIGKDFQARIILTVEGRVVTGLVIKETDSAITVATGTSTETVAKEDIDEVSISKNSFMPESLLQPLNEREKIELLKYLMTAPMDSH